MAPGAIEMAQGPPVAPTRPRAALAISRSPDDLPTVQPVCKGRNQQTGEAKGRPDARIVPKAHRQGLKIALYVHSILQCGLLTRRHPAVMTS